MYYALFIWKLTYTVHNGNHCFETELLNNEILDKQALK